MKNYNDKLMMGYYDHDGKLHKVERLDKIPEIKGVISDEVQSPIPEYHEPPEFSCKVECSEDFVRDIRDSMKKLDMMILDGYDSVAKAVECCIGGKIKNCEACAFYREADCMSKLAQSLTHIIRTQRDLCARAIEEKWKNDDEGRNAETAE